MPLGFLYEILKKACLLDMITALNKQVTYNIGAANMYEEGPML